MKGELRRHRREQEVYMQSTLKETNDAAWKWEDGSYSGQLENGQIVGTWEEGGGKFHLVFERTND